MMRFATAVTTGAGILLTVPALTSQDRVATLEGALGDTIRALEMFTDISERVESDPDAIRALRLFSEEPVGEEQERDERLFELRQEVIQLQIKLDAAEGGALPRSGADAPPASQRNDTLVLPPWAEDEPAAEGDFVVGGMNTTTRAVLDEIRAPGAAPAPKGEGEGEPSMRKVPVGPVETEGYSADPLRQARTCLRAGLHEKGLTLLAPLEDSADVLFWRGRLLEESGRGEEAIAAFDAALALSPDGPTASAASERLGFLTWKRDFEQSLPTRKGAEGAAAKSTGGKP